MKSNYQKELFVANATAATAGMQIGVELIQRDMFTATAAMADGITLAIERDACTGKRVKKRKM